MAPAVMRKDRAWLTAADVSWLHVVGRLRNGEKVQSADAEVRVIAGRLNPAGTPPDRERTARAVPIRGGMTAGEQQDLEPVFRLIALVPAIVVLLACGNVANSPIAHNPPPRPALAVPHA